MVTQKIIVIKTPKPGKLSIVNLDDPFVKSSINSSNRIQTISHLKSDIQIINTKINKSGFTADFLFNRQKYTIHLKNQIFPYSFTTSLATAILVANHLRLDPQKAIDSIQKNFQNEPGRSSLFAGIKKTIIIDSSYNSSLQATPEMIDLLSLFPGHKIAVLGDMRELGLQSAISHQQVYQKASQVADLIIGIGQETQKYFKGKNTHTFQFWWQAVDFLKNQIKGGEVILVKGSQNTIYLEELIKPILRNSKQSSQLCRQSPYWLNLKSNFKSNCFPISINSS